MICPYCGNMNDEDAKFCDECGASLTGGASPVSGQAAPAVSGVSGQSRSEKSPKKSTQNRNAVREETQTEPDQDRAAKIQAMKDRGTRVIQLRCRNCDGTMKADPEGKYMVCPYCGTRELIVESEKVALEKLKAQQRREQEQAELERASKQAEEDSRRSFEKSIFRVVLIVFAVLALLFAIIGFREGFVVCGIIGLIQAALNIVAWLMGMHIIKTGRKNLPRALFFAGMLLILPYLIFFGSGSTVTRRNLDYKWEESDLAGMVEEPAFGKTDIYLSSDTQFSADVEDVGASEYRDYVTSCAEHGFSVDADKDSNGYIAFYEDGTKLELNYYPYMKEMSVRLIAPLQIGEFSWPTTKLASLLPKPDSTTGLLDRESNTSLVIYVGDTSQKEYADYVQKCIDGGFDVDYTRDNRTFYAENADGVRLNVKYYGFDIMEIDLYVPQKDS